MGSEGLRCLQGAALRPDPGTHRRLLFDSLTMSHAEPQVPAPFMQTPPDWASKMLVLWAFRLGLAVIGWLIPTWCQTLWPAAFFWAGGLCLGNALRCGRVHCTLTGPLYLLTGLIAVSKVLGWLSLSWRWLWIATAVGT